jgi:hypothetical protein
MQHHHARRFPYVQLLVLLLVSVSSTTTTNARCRLNCANGGYCSYKETDQAQLAHDIQSGQLVQKCTCPPGFGGMGCEITGASVCKLPERRCNDGSDCAQRNNGEYTCDCLVADRVSKFAGMMCRKTFTEYCNTASAATDFCTNGGKCKGSFVAAHLAPGNTSANAAFANLGCICNPAFYGPHCEFLKVPHHQLDSESDGGIALLNNNNNNNNNDDDAKTAFPITVLVAAVAGILSVFLGSVTLRRFRYQSMSRRQQQQQHQQQGQHQGRNLGTGNIIRGEEENNSAVEFAPLTRAGRNII